MHTYLFYVSFVGLGIGLVTAGLDYNTGSLLLASPGPPRWLSLLLARSESPSPPCSSSLEHDLTVKNNSIYVDREVCLGKRKNFPLSVSVVY